MVASGGAEHRPIEGLQPGSILTSSGSVTTSRPFREGWEQAVSAATLNMALAVPSYPPPGGSKICRAAFRKKRPPLHPV